jgi:hypothetical protein
MDNFDRLTQYLQQYPNDQKRLSFREIEQILGEELPAGAYENLEWWDDTTTITSPQANAWLAAGWRVSSVDLTDCWVKFRLAPRSAGAGRR